MQYIFYNKMMYNYLTGLYSKQLGQLGQSMKYQKTRCIIKVLATF